MTTAKMRYSTAAEVVHILEVIKKYGVSCSLEFKSEGFKDPLLGFAGVPIAFVELYESDHGNSVIVKFDENEFAFEAKSCSFFKDITDVQIEICIANDHFSAFFNSDHIHPNGIEEARNYSDDLDDKEIQLNAIDGSEFDESVEWLKSLLHEGRVIKKSVVIGDGQQVLTVGYFNGSSK